MAIGNNAIRLTGLEDTLDGLNRSVKRIKGRTLKGLIKAGLFIQRESQNRVPVDTGNLRASAFTVWGPSGAGGKGSFSDGGKKGEADRLRQDHQKVKGEIAMSIPGKLMQSIDPRVAVGFSAYYALFVHESINQITGGAKKGSGTFKKRKMNAATGKRELETRDRQSKFLEDTITQEQPRIMNIIRKEATK